MKIDNHVPIPKYAPKHGSAKYPFREMEVGDSFFIERKEDVHRAKAAARMMANRTRLVFTMRREDNGVRIWRTA